MMSPAKHNHTMHEHRDEADALEQMANGNPIRYESGVERISDEELLGRQFRFDDPEGIANLCRERPRVDLEPEIVGYYQVRPSGGRVANPDVPYIWCCHCQKRTHWNGRVVRDRSGHTYIIGADCGRAHYGDSYVAIDRAFDERLARQGLLARWSRILALRETLLPELDRVLQDPFWGAIDRKRQEVRRVAPDLVFRLAPIAKRRSPLIVREVIRDLEAEERRRQSYERAKTRYKSLPKVEQARARREGLAPERDESPIFRTVEESLGPVRGMHALIDDGDVREHALKLKTLVGSMDPIGELQATRNSQLSRTLATIRSVGEHLREAFKETGSTWLFFEPGHLAKIERWYASGRPTPLAGGATDQPWLGSLAGLVKPLERGTYFRPPAMDTLLESEPIAR